jgi:hypothetical protein
MLANGGNILFPAGVSCVFGGTVDINVTGIHLIGGGPSGQGTTGPAGATVFNFTGTGTGNAFNIGTQSSSSQIYNVSIENATISAANRTGGYVFSEYGVGQTALRNISVAGGWWLLYGENFNTLAISNLTSWLNAASGWLISLYGKVGVDRSDVLTFSNVVLNNDAKGANGMVADGTIYTVSANHFVLLGVSTGIQTQNSQAVGAANTTQGYLFDDLEIDGAGVNCGNGVNLAAGSQFHFVNSDIDVSAAGTSCTSGRPFAASYDPNAGTEGIYIVATALHDSPLGALYLNAHDVLVNSVMMYDLQHGSVVADSAVTLAPSSADVLISNSKLGYWQYSSGQVKYGVNVNSGAARVSLSNNDYYNATSGNVVNNSSSIVGLWGGIGYNGNAITAITCAASSTC